MSRLKSLGVEHVTGYERYDAFGGTWHPKLRYHSIQIHGAMWITSFSKYPYSKVADDQNGKVSGEEVEDYVKRFADDKGLNENYKLNSRVVHLKYESEARTAMLVIEDEKGLQREEGPFDFVIYASQASEPSIPNIPGSESFGGKILHSQQFKKDQFDEILRNEKKVVVVGGSKAGSDVALCFQRCGYQAFDWVYRSPYLFWKYELMFHNRSFVNMLRGFTTILALLWSLVSKTLAGWILWSSGLTVTHGNTPHNNWNKFHFGILCPTQRRDLAAIPTEKRIVGNPKGYFSGGLELDDGRKVKADYVIFGTGCQSGIDKLSFEKDGLPYTLHPDTNLLNHFIVPAIPVFANSTALWTTFGPVRACNSADLAIYHCCVRKKMTEKAMQLKASRQFCGGVNSLSGFLFQSKSFGLRKWVLMHLDLMLAGLVDFFDFLWHALQVFCLSEQDALKFRILPDDIKSEYAKL